ncbi:MAG: aminotransferase class III-fold pyridoxal phosphate-dependent enzyme [Phycisphaerales bacterium]
MTPAETITRSASASASASAAETAAGILPALAGTPAVKAAFEQVLRELRQAQAALTGARPPQPEKAALMEQWMTRAAQVRGRAPHYRYLGTGLGNGPLVELVDGSVKWDMINGIGVHMFGHGDPGMTEAALQAALADTVQEGNLQFNADSIAFGEFLVKEASRATRMRHAFVSNSGCMVNEAALKVCQQKRQSAPRIIAFADCFMGRSTTMTQIGDTAGYRQGVALNVMVDYMPFYDPELGPRSAEMTLWHLRQVVARYPGQHCCFVMELVQGEGGFNAAPRDFFLPLMELCRAEGIPVWDDEVQTFGRTTSMLACEALGLGDYVDVLTLGKMSQACACLYTPEMSPKPGLLSGTFAAGAAAFQVGLRALTTLRDGGYYGPEGRIARLHAAFRSHAEALVARHPEWFPPVRDALGRESRRVVGGVGGMMRLTPFGGDKERINRLLGNLFEDGVIAFNCGHGPYHLRFLPPVGVMQPEHFGPVFEILERSMARSA